VVSRVFTISNPQVIALLKDFIPVAANQDYLVPLEQSHRDWSETAKFMTEVCRKNGRGIKPGETVQGYYMFSAAGDIYGHMGAWQESSEAPWLITILEQARKKWLENPPAKVELKEISLGPESKVPEGAVVLRVFTRIDPLPQGLDEKRDRLNRNIQRDYLWILKDEQAEILKRLAEHKEAELPGTLSRRILSYHLTDNVRGEADPWGMEHVKSSSFRIRRGKDTGTSLGVTLTGTFSMEDKNANVGLTGTLEGMLELDRGQKRIKMAKIYASGEAFGQERFTMGAPDGRFPLKIAMVLADDDLSRNVAPHAIHVGSEEGNGRMERYLGVGGR
jgi:hypothetical protein